VLEGQNRRRGLSNLLQLGGSLTRRGQVDRKQLREANSTLQNAANLTIPSQLVVSLQAEAIPRIPRTDFFGGFMRDTT
jgi:hypothetical protein